jgi:hypothetical protein
MPRWGMGRRGDGLVSRLLEHTLNLVCNLLSSLDIQGKFGLIQRNRGWCQININGCICWTKDLDIKNDGLSLGKSLLLGINLDRRMIMLVSRLLIDNL